MGLDLLLFIPFFLIEGSCLTFSESLLYRCETIMLYNAAIYLV